MYPPGLRRKRVHRAKRVLTFVALTGLGTTGCGSRSYVVTRTSDAPVVSKSPDCDFEIVTAPAGSEYEEVATLETEGQPAVTAAEFQRVVGKQVCELGGDVV